MPQYRQVLIATDSVSFHQALYINDELRMSDSSVYASEIPDYLEEDEPVIVRSVMVQLGDSDCFPDVASELKIVEE